jgi:hypothetical protein
MPDVKPLQQTALMHARAVANQTKPCKQAGLQQGDEPGESDLPEPLRGNGVLAHLPPRGMNAGAKPASGKWKPAAESSSKAPFASVHDARRPLHRWDCSAQLASQPPGASKKLPIVLSVSAHEGEPPGPVPMLST